MLISGCQIEAQFLQVSKFEVSHLTSSPTLAVIYTICRAGPGEILISTLGGPGSTSWWAISGSDLGQIPPLIWTPPSSLDIRTPSINSKGRSQALGISTMVTFSGHFYINTLRAIKEKKNTYTIFYLSLFNIDN